MFIIYRRLNKHKDEFNPEFTRIRSQYHDDAEMDESFGEWLRARGAEAVTSKPESDIQKTRGVYKVLEIRFPSENAYLAFKLKYL